MKSYDVVIIGAGPGGYVAAIRAAQLGMKVAVVEKAPRLGGTCLNVGCIPSKAMLESSALYQQAQKGFGAHGIGLGDVTLDLAAMLARKQKVVNELTDGIRLLMKKNKVDVLIGEGQLAAADHVVVQGDGEATQLRAQSVILATGSQPVQLPFLPTDGQQIVTSTEALSFDRVPGHLLVIGAGAIGLELGSVWCRLGAKVTVVEMMDQIVPHADTQSAKLLARYLRKQGLDIRVSSQVTAAESAAQGVEVSVKDAKGRVETLVADKVLVAVGRRPYTDGLGLADVGVGLDEQGRIRVDETYSTSVRGVYAIGDLIHGPMLAHKASEEGIALTEMLAGKPGHVNYDAVPNVVYTHPELAAVGLTEEQAKTQELDCRVGRYYFKANGRAKTMSEEEGFVKILADARTDRLLGAHIVGPHASDIVAEIVIAVEMHASCEDLARAVHAHPTLAEAIKEAALAVDKRAIHG